MANDIMEHQRRTIKAGDRWLRSEDRTAKLRAAYDNMLAELTEMIRQANVQVVHEADKA